jgi:mono/diheme cytochrome c family protein
MSRGFPRATLATVLGLAAALASAPQARGEFGDPVRGQALFVEKGCVQCHAVRGTGGRIGPDLGRTAVKGSFFEIAAGIWNHAIVMGNKMQEARITRPSFKNDELGDLIAFLYFLNYFDEPGDPKVGKVLFVQKHCIQCHRIGQEGGTAGPPLDRLPRGTAPLRIAQGLWNHGPVMVPAIRRVGMEVPKFEGSEIVDLFAYLRSRGQRQAVREFRSAGDPERGKKVFADKGCANCHAIFGRGSAIGPDLGRAELRGSVTQLAGRMWNHWPAMTEAMGAMGMASPTFHGDQMADLFAFLFLSRYEGRPGDIARGQALFELKGCSACHGQRGEGNIGPALGPFVSGQKKEQIAQLMWNHASAMGTSMRAYGVAWPRFEADEMSNLVAFLAGGLPNSPAAGRESGSPAKPEPAVKK